MDWTGPDVWTDTVFEYLSTIQSNTDWHNVTGISQGKVIGDVVVLPITSFSPGVGTMVAFGPDHPHAFVYLSLRVPGSPRTSATSAVNSHIDLIPSMYIFIIPYCVLQLATNFGNTRFVLFALGSLLSVFLSYTAVKVGYFFLDWVT
ncbi:hypothetical protein V1506DRAFT_521659 [Lipomyces tetrasporus]